MISPRRVYWYSPGSEDWISPVVTPSHRLPPLCGQRLLSAKNSPARLNTTTARPFTSTSLRRPGGMSLTPATTYFGIQIDTAFGERPRNRLLPPPDRLP